MFAYYVYAHTNVSVHIRLLFIRLHCALGAVSGAALSSPHKKYTTIGTVWSHCQARQQTTTPTYRGLEGVARCKHKCVCMCMYLRMHVYTMCVCVFV